MKSLSILILLIIILTGCETIFAVKEIDQFHPARSLPVSVTAPKWNLLTPTTHDTIIVDDTAYSYMCLSWENYLVMGQNMQNIIKGFKDYNALLCYYRKELKEVVCKEYLPNE